MASKEAQERGTTWRPGRIGIIGSGSWGTAIAKIVLANRERINWYFRFGQTIKEFKKYGHNPSYLTTQQFDTERIDFFTDIPSIVAASDTLILVTPSPYIKNTLQKAKSGSLEDKFLLNAIKGIVTDEYVIISEYLQEEYGLPPEQIGVMSGPTHAEEVALDRLSYLTVACVSEERAKALSRVLTSPYVTCETSTDVAGIEYGSVLKNIYAIAAGITQGMRMGDNFQAVLIANAAAEMRRFLDVVQRGDRLITDSVYLGDLLVTAYSRYSRNRTFGTLLGKGYSVKQAQNEMEMISEGYYGAKCIHEVNKLHQVDLPIAETMYQILYHRAKPEEAMEALSTQMK